MTKVAVDDVFRVLRFAPNGMTTVEVAERLNLNKDLVSLRLSKMADYGKINREYEKTENNKGRTRRCRWRMREEAHA